MTGIILVVACIHGVCDSIFVVGVGLYVGQKLEVIRHEETGPGHIGFQLIQHRWKALTEWANHFVNPFVTA